MSGIFDLSINTLLSVWGELVLASIGKNGFGGNVAELYEYRFRTPLDTKGEDEPSRAALGRLRAVIDLFAIEHGRWIVIDGVLVADPDGLTNEGCRIQPNGHRYHVEVYNRKSFEDTDAHWRMMKEMLRERAYSASRYHGNSFVQSFYSLLRDSVMWTEDAVGKVLLAQRSFVCDVLVSGAGSKKFEDIDKEDVLALRHSLLVHQMKVAP